MYIIRHSTNNCHVCRYECFGICHHQKHYGEDVWTNSTPCEDYEYGGTEDILEEIVPCEKEKSKMKITHEMNMHNCQLCRNESLGMCNHDKHYGKDVSVNNTPCEDYEYGGTEERLEEIEQCKKEKSGMKMTAFDYCEKKIKILKTMNNLEEYLYNDTETVLLTNNEVKDIMESLKDCTMIIDEKLKSF